MNKETPSGERATNQGPVWVAVGGVPLLYMAVAAVVIIIMGFIPASVVIGESGGGWPLHDAIHPLVGLVIGPIAGPIISAIGFIISNIITPYTSLGANSYLIGAMSAFTVGMVAQRNKRYWLIPWLMIAAAHIIFFFETRGYDISPLLWFSNTFTVTIALIITAIPAVRHWMWQTIATENAHWKMTVAFYILFFLGSTGGIQLYWAIVWPINPWGAEFWPDLVIVVLLERTIFTLIGALIAVFVVPVLRQSAWPKPSLAGY